MFSLTDFVFLSLLIFAGLCQGFQEDFDYHHLQEWPDICLNGKAQSPINIITQNTHKCQGMRLSVDIFDGASRVAPQGLDVKNQFRGTRLSFVNQENNQFGYSFYGFSSVQYHLHSPSEHKIDGAASSAEIHILHKLDQFYQGQQTMGVLSIMFQLDLQATTDIFDQINFLKEPDKQDFTNFFDALHPFLSTVGFFHYKGSLTTPGCDQAVDWFVVDKFMPISMKNLKKLISVIHNGDANNRPIQKLNNRKVYHLTPQCNRRNIKVQTHVIRLYGQKTFIFIFMSLVVFMITFS